MTPTGVLGGPLFRLPWGFHFRACFVALSGCFLNCMRVTNPFQFSWPHLCLNGFLTRLLPKIFIRYSVCPRYLQDSSQTFVDKCLQLVVRCFVFLPVSEPYNRTLFTLPLKILSFVLREITREFHTFFSKLKTTRALLILTLMSLSVPPFTLTVLPRYANDEIFFRFLSLILIGLLDVQLIFMILVLSTLGFSPSVAEFFIIVVVLSCICWLLLERTAMSSAKSRFSNCFCRFHWMPICCLIVSPSVFNQAALFYACLYPKTV